MNENLTPQIVAALLQDGTVKMTGEEIATAIADAVGALEKQYRFPGVATPDAAPGKILEPTLYVAVADATYGPFSNQSVDNGQIVFFTSDDGAYWEATVAYDPNPGGGGTAEIFFSGTSSEVKALRSQGKLVPGASYRITDYVATTTQEGTQSANHPFDIIVKAIAPDTLSEEALAAPHDGDTYFTGLGAKLEAWRLMYCIDDDATRFIWADTENGKGVVYRLVDEWGNDAPYDFKGILILRDAAFWSSNAAATALAENTFGTQTPGDKYLYLFSAVDSEGNILDASSTRVNGVIEEEPAGLITCMENVFAGYDGGYTDDGECIYAIANNVFLAKISDEDWDHTFYVSNNAFSGGVQNNTFSGGVQNNTFSGNLEDNTFSGNVKYNTFSGGVDMSAFNGVVANNTFGGYVYNNTFSGNVSENTFPGDVGNNTFSGDVGNNIFPGEVSACVFHGSFSQVTIQGTGTKAMGECVIDGDASGITLVASGPNPTKASYSEFANLHFTGQGDPQTAQTVQVQRNALYEQVISTDVDGIFHVFTPWINP